MKKQDRVTAIWEVKPRGHEVHAVPKDDGFKHVTRSECLCEPKLEAASDGHLFYVHNPRNLAN